MQSLLITMLISFLSFPAYAVAEVQFSAQVDQNQISLQDTLALKLVITLDNNSSASEPRFSANDFRVVNEFNSVSVQYDSLRGMQKSQEITVILKPMKVGSFKISGIQVKVNDRVLSADDIQVQVLAASSAPKRQGGRVARGIGGGAGFMGGFPGRMRLGGQGLPNLNSNDQREEDRTKSNQKTNAFIRAEINRSSVYKGEQLVVSYYLYHQMKVFNLQVEKFPMLSGFLREDLEMPIMGQRLESEPVTLKGEQYRRSLLARYAAYPLQEGKLDIDSMQLKFSFYANQREALTDDEDPFFSFFQQLSPRAADVESDHLSIQVLPLPGEGRPASFVGGVGDFTVSSAVNKYQVKANEAVSYILKIEGHGNVANIQEPKAQWPSTIELYESKGKAQTGRGGVGQKVFEFLIIPRTSGKVILPPLELGFFDPTQKRYYTKSTDAIELTVAEAAPGTTPPPATISGDSISSKSSAVIPSAPSAASSTEPRGLKPILNHSEVESSQSFIWRILYVACSTCFGFLVIVVIRDIFLRRRAARGPLPKWAVFYSAAQKAAAGAAWKEVTETYEALTEVLLEAIDQKYHVGARSFSRNQLKEVLHEERGLPIEMWNRIATLLEFTELVRFASSIGAISESEARSRLAHWVAEAETIVKNISQKKK